MRSLAEGKTANIPFNEFVDVVLCFGFVPDGHRGSHQFYKLSGRSIGLNLQPRRGEAKDYQTRPLLAYVEEFQLERQCK
jgi:hypothetical protein